jgi:hypothetical protein
MNTEFFRMNLLLQNNELEKNIPFCLSHSNLLHADLYSLLRQQ